MKQILSLTLVVILCFSMAFPVAAASPRFNYTNSISACLDIDTTWGVATCTGEVLTDGNYFVELVVRLQVYRDGSWQTVKSWTTTGNYSAYLSKPYAIYRGYEYRVYAVGYIYNENNAVIEVADVADYLWYN